MKGFASFFGCFSRKTKWAGGDLGGESSFADMVDGGWKQEGRKHPERAKADSVISRVLGPEPSILEIHT